MLAFYSVKLYSGLAVNRLVRDCLYGKLHNNLAFDIKPVVSIVAVLQISHNCFSYCLHCYSVRQRQRKYFRSLLDNSFAQHLQNYISNVS